jgi:predicted enzyme related to lactoylglutathione lyase
MAHVVGTTDKPAEVENQDKVAFIFSVEDVDATYSQLQRRGLRS